MSESNQVVSFEDELLILVDENDNIIDHKTKEESHNGDGILHRAFSVFIFDDIYWSKPMSEAWAIIINHPKVTVSIDTFYWGIVFFRKEQVKEHFTVRV